MTNKWIEHIKSFAKAHNISYGCALSNPECLATYKSKNISKEAHSAPAPVISYRDLDKALTEVKQLQSKLLSSDKMTKADKNKLVKLMANARSFADTREKQVYYNDKMRQLQSSTGFKN